MADDPFNATKVYVGGPRDGETVRCIGPSRWPLSIAGLRRASGRHTYELDVVESTDDRAVYRYVGHLAEQDIYRRPDTRALATHCLDQLDGATAELGHWLRTGERVQCPRCTQTVPAAADHAPVRHQLRGQWCAEQDGDGRDRA